MTEKLYYADAYLKEFEAEVIDCRKRKSGFAILLDKTAFYPEGGGQPGDTGALSGIPVLDTHEKDGEILHYTDSEIAVGTVVHAEINWARRFSLMQQHSGEHIVSGLIHERFGFENVGFHMGADAVTIDFDGVVGMELLREIEREANARIWENARTDIAFYSGAELEKINYRSKKAIDGEVRIVSFPESDTCACCGTHVAYTGEIGCIRLLSVQSLRSGVRIEMLAGESCYDYFNDVASANHAISTSLSVKERETPMAVERLKDENQKLKMRLAELENAHFSAIAEKYAGAERALVFENGLSPDSVRRLCDAIMQRCLGECAVFSGADGEGYKYAVGQVGGDLRTRVKELNGALNGRGGGKPAFAQGSVSASKGEIIEFFSKAVEK